MDKYLKNRCSDTVNPYYYCFLHVFLTAIAGIFTLLVFISPAFSQTRFAYPPTEKYHFRHLTTEDGLPANMCLSVLNDAHGFLWISTRNGLCRYDGYNIKLYQNDPLDSTSISDNTAGGPQGMVLDRNGRLWISTYNNLNRFDAVSETFKRYRPDPANPGSIKGDRIYCLSPDNAGSLLIGTGGQQMYVNRYLPDQDQFIAFSLHPGNHHLTHHAVLSVYEDSMGDLWAGTTDGLYEFDPTEDTFRLIPYMPKEQISGVSFSVNLIKEDIDGILFLGSSYGFLTYDKEKNELVPFDLLYHEGGNYDWMDILPDPTDQNILWMALWRLYQYNRQEQSVIQIAYDPSGHTSIRGELVNSLFFDKTNVLWVSTERGLASFDHYHNQIEIHPEFSKQFHRSNSFMEDRDGNLWIGTFDLVCFDSAMKLVKEFRLPDSKDFGYPEKIIICMLEDAAGNIWIGTESKGLYLLPNGSRQITRCAFQASEPRTITDLFEDSQGYVWIATDIGLYQRKTGTGPPDVFHQEASWGILNNAYVLDIFEDRAGNLWIGTNTDGLFFKPAEQAPDMGFHQYTNDPFDTTSISSNAVWSLYEDGLNELWIATTKGLNRFVPEKNKFKRYINSVDPGSNFIYNLTGDNNGNLWMVTESGLIRYNAVSGSATNEIDPQFSRFLPFSDIFPYKIYKNRAGKIFIGAAFNSGKGFFSFYPEKIIDNKFIPPVVVTDFRIRNSPGKTDTSIFLKEHIVLKFNQNFFTFEMAVLDFQDPSANQYAHYLEGLEEGWIYTGKNRFANYTDVAPGKYIFHVKGSNSKGYWNEAGKSLRITILPPPWKTWWAYMLYAISFLAIIFMAIRFYLNRLRLAHRLELEQVESRKIRELDSMKSRFFANISHEFRTPLTLILGPLEKALDTVSGELKDDLILIQRNARRLHLLINELLSISRLESGQMKLRARELNLASLVNGYVQSFESYAKQRKIELVFQSDADDIRACVDREKLEKILYNLLSNAFKFTPSGGRVSVAVSSQQSTVSSQMKNSYIKNTADCRLLTADLLTNCIGISVSDTGPGISPVHLPHIFDRFYQADDSYIKDQEGTGIGLALAKELVELHHGEIRVESKLGKGTTFFVLLPLGGECKAEEEKRGKGEEGKRGRGEEEKRGKGEEELEEFETWNVEHETQNTKHETRNTEHETDKPLLLIVEDNRDLRYYIRGFLEDSYSIVECGDGKAGFEKALETIPDLVISDVMMPVMDGYELCTKLKTDERTSHIPVILLTARAGMESKIEGLETGADDFITKPFDPSELQARIRNLLSQRRRIREGLLKELKKGEEQSLLKFPVTGLNEMDRQFLTRALKLVEERMSDTDFDIETFSREMALSRSQLHRKLHSIISLSSTEFIRTIRLNKAAAMLRAGSGTVSEIAFDVGFNTLPYFTRCFREQFGVAPSEYMNSSR